MAKQAAKNPYPVTPDGRYFVVRGRLWRCTNPHLAADEKQRLTQELMQARRQVQTAQRNPQALRQARQQVNAAKVALGERGPPWWDDGGPTYDRCMAKNTPYGAWYQALEPKA